MHGLTTHGTLTSDTFRLALPLPIFSLLFLPILSDKEQDYRVSWVYVDRNTVRSSPTLMKLLQV